MENGSACLVSGGTVLAIGSSDMAETFDGESGQCSFLYNFAETFAAGTRIAVTDAAGNVLFEHIAAKEFSSVVFSRPELAFGDTCVLSVGEQTIEMSAAVI